MSPNHHGPHRPDDGADASATADGDPRTRAGLPEADYDRREWIAIDMFDADEIRCTSRRDRLALRHRQAARARIVHRDMQTHDRILRRAGCSGPFIAEIKRVHFDVRRELARQRMAAGRERAAKPTAQQRARSANKGRTSSHRAATTTRDDGDDDHPDDPGEAYVAAAEARLARAQATLEAQRRQGADYLARTVTAAVEVAR